MKFLFAVKSKEIETLGVMYLAAVVKQGGHEARIVTFSETVDVAFNWNPDFVGFSVMTGDQKKVKAIAARLKKLNHPPDILVGGPHPTFFPDDFTKDKNITMVIKGEAEEILAAMVNSPAKYPTIDSYPWPDRTDFPNHIIRDFISSRGCPYNCSYCYNQRWAEMFPDVPRVRFRSVDDVVKEIKSVSPDFVYFQDSCFGTSMKWFREFSKKYAREVSIPYHCHLRPNQVTEERVELLSESRCYSVRIALESASTRLRRLMNRGRVDAAEVIQATRLFKKRRIALMIQNMIGFPTGTIEEDLDTLDFNIRCRPSYAWVSIFSPYPGTELGDMCKERGWYKGDYSEISDSFFDTSVLDFPPEYIEQLECLQKIFALSVECEYLPGIKELTHQNFPKLVHKILRRTGDKRLYAGLA